MENASQDAHSAKDLHAGIAAGELLMAALDSFHRSGSLQRREAVVSLSRAQWGQMLTTMSSYEAKVRGDHDEDWLRQVKEAIDLIRRGLG